MIGGDEGRRDDAISCLIRRGCSGGSGDRDGGRSGRRAGSGRIGGNLKRGAIVVRVYLHDVPFVNPSRNSRSQCACRMSKQYHDEGHGEQRHVYQQPPCTHLQVNQGAAATAGRGAGSPIDARPARGPISGCRSMRPQADRGTRVQGPPAFSRSDESIEAFKNRARRRGAPRAP